MARSGGAAGLGKETPLQLELRHIDGRRGRLIGKAARRSGKGARMSDQSWYVDHPEIIVVAKPKVSCDGGGVLGHPKVWYDMGEDDWVECKYCDRVFVLKGGGRDPGAK